MSSLSRWLGHNSLPDGCFIEADEAYTCISQILKPHSGRNLSPAKDAFNFCLSSARMFIEQSFGLLVARWSILWRPLRTSLTVSSLVVVVCMNLHNFIVDSCDGRAVSSIYFAENVPGSATVYLQDQLDTDVYILGMRWDLETSELRA